MGYTSYYLRIPSIKSMKDLADQMNLSEHTLYQMAAKTERFYRESSIKKRSGGNRILAIPSSKLKAIQSWILRFILESLPSEPAATAFKKNQNIRKNLEPHAENSCFLCLDIEDFFPSITRKNIYNFFRSLNYAPKIAIVLTNFCTYKDGLPQGAVTSPALSNLINVQLDRRISGYAGLRNVIYTRYADDITLSSDNHRTLRRARKVVERIIQDEGYKVNGKKTRILRPGMSRKVTGLVCSEDKKVGVGREKKRLLRAKIYNLEMKTPNADEAKKKVAHIMGWLAFLKDVDSDTYDYLIDYWGKLKDTKRLSAIPEAAATDEENDLNTPDK